MTDGETARVFLGIDGGGSKTLAVIVDDAGCEWGRGMAGSSNHEAVGRTGSSRHPRSCREGYRRRCGAPTFGGVDGLAGVDHPRVDALLPQVRSFATTVRISNDAELVLSAFPRHRGRCHLRHRIDCPGARRAWNLPCRRMGPYAWR